MMKTIVGLGKTGLSCARYLTDRGVSFNVVDSRRAPPGYEEFKRLFPKVSISLGGLDQAAFSKSDEIILSPGISVNHPVIQQQIALGKAVIGDVELFLREAKAPVVAVTGSNGKSTVVTLLGDMAKEADISVLLGGNLGRPVLDLLNDPLPEFYMLELSSFQLQSVPSLKAYCAAVLNLSEDHLDHHQNMDEYRQAKMRIYDGCQFAVCNLDQPELCPTHAEKVLFTASHPQSNQYGLIVDQSKTFLACGEDRLIDVGELKLFGKSYWLNSLAALAIGKAIGMSHQTMIGVIKRFSGLPHRCELVKTNDHVAWFNDSKATNVGATIAAIESLSGKYQGNFVVIMGGDAKGSDLSPLTPVVKKHVSHVVLLGKATEMLHQQLNGLVETTIVRDMESAVETSRKLVGDSGVVLLSPACSSLDMFNNFEHRGIVYSNIVKEL